jgi:hypothetical protein
MGTDLLQSSVAGVASPPAWQNTTPPPPPGPTAVSAVANALPWVASTQYAANQIVTNGGNFYISSIPHLSGASFSADSAYWTQFAGGSGGAVSSVFGRTGAVTATSGDYTVAEVTGAAPLASPSFTGTVNSAGTIEAAQGLVATAGAGVTGTILSASGASGATALSRWVGATSSGAPSSGTFALGDFVIDQTGKVWICTAAGTPGTWANAGASAGVSSFNSRTGAITPTSGDYTVAQVTGAAGTTATQTLTNKRVTPRNVTVTQSATPTINTDNTDVATISALAQAITSMTTNLSGTPLDGDPLIVRITDNGTARAITWGASFEASTIALPTATVGSAMLTVGFMYNGATSKWRCVGVA